MADMARSAIYYPHTGIRTVELLKSGLLLWDQVEYIAPFQDFEPTPPRDQVEDERTIREAMELLLVRHVPSEEEKQHAHKTIVRFADSDLAERLRDETLDDGYLIYPEKFSETTWKALKRAQLAHISLSDPDGDYAMSPVVGLIMMSVLADACAGTLKRTITDQHAAYAIVRESIVKNTLSSQGADKDRKALVDVTIKVADLTSLSLKKLVELRQREQRSGGYSLTQLRYAFVAKVDEAAKRMAALSQESDRREVQRQFESDTERDFQAIRQELGGLGWKALFSREMVVGMLSTAGLLTQPLGQMMVAVTALVGLGVAYRRERRAALANHAMSWLYVQH
jgi:hypothetical protein